jgi:cobyrinic acid a,c-diamide synthase
VLVIAGTNSGVGKSSITLGIARAFTRRGLRVRAAKVGPDFLDPMQLSAATGRPCLNLDSYMMGQSYVQRLVAEQAHSSDLVLIEGVMGLFDGEVPESSSGSTAEIARCLSAPIVLVADASGQSRSFAASVHGFNHLEPGLDLVGVIANRVGSVEHARLLGRALDSASLPRLLGAIAKDALPTLASRHLGLMAPSGTLVIDALAQAVEAALPLEDLLRLARPYAGPSAPAAERLTLPQRGLRLAVAEDRAFGFIYADLRERLIELGVQWIPCSPLVDRALPDEAQALFLPGGYPEEHAAELAANQAFLSSLASFASRRPVYAECGGLMLLGESLLDRHGVRHRLSNVLPLSTRMGERAARLGYAEVTLREHTHWGDAGASCRGHEFHYSSVELVPPESLTRGYEVSYRRGTRQHEGYMKNRVLGSYVHLHLASRASCLTHFVEELMR